MNSIILIGCGGHAKSIIDTLETSKEWEIGGLIGLPTEMSSRILGYSLIGTDSDLEFLRNKFNYACIAIGQLKSPNKRIEIAKMLQSYNYKLPNIISPFSVISKHSKLGIGNFISHGSIINAGSQIENCCIINSNALIEHDVIIKSYSHVSTGVILNGGVEIGERCFIGSGVIIREGIKIPPNSVITAGKRIMGWPLKNE